MMHKNLHPSRPLMAALASLLVACGGGGATASPSPAPAPAPAPSPAPAPAPTPAPSNRWTLVWSDEFEGAAGTLPNAKHWNYDLGNKESNGWGNHELQYYTAAARNAALDGQGHLLLRAEKQANAGPCWNDKPCEYSSGRLRSDGKVSFSYGKLEARIKIPGGPGIWPAFWTLGEDKLPWPAAGEIDVLENIGKEPNNVYGTVHGPGYSGAQGIGKKYSAAQPISQDFHVFTLIKRPQELVWLIDGVEYHRLTPAGLPAGAPWVFERAFFVILNLAVGGDWPGNPDASTPFPAEMQVDWVRIYKED
ncbi:glycoside hydrolase family 16 protein [Paucibacter sp. DJ2R-2]|uniref:glycoside hydrolase family 16 protein n=1 Tax=Paucibacter sp. DJ2R-2 TaxID=2893558 RepID=UPI0021E4137F|nr:glycoside hydrolase family 16 protein [Paucibacter sp. DJ2R-2]MCV2422777.1 glycoside hydrolase family 16 protein [Paucibacter sp. DJ4R-1]MCV2441082.1 glycoside hydrolase family 16 protein [Paucibacter sp. DJ2R-2]